MTDVHEGPVHALLTVPQFGADLVDDFLALLPEGARATHPVDATAAVGEEQHHLCAHRLAKHGAVDAVLVVLVPTGVAATTDGDIRLRLVPRHTPAPCPRLPR